MELVLEILNSEQSDPSQVNRKVFTVAGGSIGRRGNADWLIIDSTSQVSRRHALVSYCGSHFCLTDLSTNGTWDNTTGERMTRGDELRIVDGGVYQMGRFEVRAQVLRDSVEPAAEVSTPTPPSGNRMTIPEDAYFGQMPMASVDQPFASSMPAPESQQCADYAPIEREHVRTPTLVAPTPTAEPIPEPPPAPPAHQGEVFWQQFAQALGIDIDDLDPEGREALAVNTARLFKQCIGGLQQSLRTRSELKNELRLALTTGQYIHKNPLKHAVSASEAVNSLLLASKPQLSAEQAISRTFHDLQAHQVALLSASRAALRSTLEHFAPQHLTLRFERDGHNPLFATAGSQWRAYGRYHQALSQDDDWSERLLARDFAHAYEEQVRLVDSLHTDYQG
ncbi:type VI secretion system-associated FHA domain protein TagH [Pseudomonas sp. UMAB-08]|uniref:type VI secretion system-associated FHA domain protein TagH n=1 Tax=Pseudomonas sp. UMAB-08 TaxID=1365375 RepID=UPI001C56F014|nr:type VI secretion system-associated FHA domain protein TagH [Pseudomonas sp. UMAB-08]